MEDNKTFVYLLDDEQKMHPIVEACFKGINDFLLEKKFVNFKNLLRQLEKDKENNKLPDIIIFDKVLNFKLQEGEYIDGYEVGDKVFNSYPNIKRVIYTADMIEDREIERAIKSNMHGLLNRGNVDKNKNDLIECLRKVRDSEEVSNIHVPALCSDIPLEKYSRILGKVNKNLNLRDKFKTAPTSWRVFLHLAKGTPSLDIKDYKGGKDGMRQVKLHLRTEINALIKADPNKEKWNFLKDIEDNKGFIKKEIKDTHYPIIAIILRVTEIQDWYKEKFGISISY